MPKGVYARKAGQHPDRAENSPNTIKHRLALIGGPARVRELMRELAPIFKVYPELKNGAGPEIVADLKPVKAKKPLRKKMSATQRAALSKIQKAIWESKRKKHAKSARPVEDINPKTGKPYKMNLAARRAMARAQRKRAKSPEGRAHMRRMVEA